MVFEANYDETMLTNGHYPADLKRRIKSNTGHLSNVQAAEFLAENFQEHLKFVFLCHLSKENNHPDIAFSTIKRYLENKNIKVGEDVQLITLERFTPTELFILN
jgi:phosphoribosyl 1,2-cyclic phosphodiesterase